MKRLIATLLAAAMCFSLGVSAFAAENTAERAYEGMTTEEMYAQASLFARARGIEILPYDEAMADTNAARNIDSPEISYDYEGKYELVDGKVADDPLFVEPYGGSSQSNAQEISVPSTTSDSIPTAGAVDWFKFRVNGNGAHNLYSIGSTDTKVEFYKKTLLGGYELIDSNDDGGSGSNFRLELGLKTGVDYYVKVMAFGSKTGSYSLRIEENKDSLYSPNGGSWRWDVASPDPDGALFNIDKLVYLTADEAEGYYIMVSRDSFRQVRDKILSLSFNAAVALLMNTYGITEAVASFIVGEAASFVYPSLTDIELDSIASAAGINSSGHATRGLKIVSLTSYTSSGIPIATNTYEKWTGSYIYGQARYRGTFDTTDKTPLWR